MSGNKKVKVLYIAGWGRSGSTLLDNILGQAEGFFSAGELRHIWYHSVLQNTLCGCGSKFRDCDIWNNIFDEAFEGFDGIDAQRMVELTHKETRSWRIPWLLFTKGKGRISASRREYLDVLEKLYLTIGAVTHSNVIVDSSKNPVYACMLMLIPSIDLYVIHLVRDPRAVAFSWTSPKSTKEVTGKQYLEYRNPLLSSIYWSIWNFAIAFIGRIRPSRYFQMRYEDFISEPQIMLTNIFDNLDIHPHHLPFVSNQMINLRPTHTVWGNPGRFHIGTIELKLDERWKRKMGVISKLMVLLATWPIMIRWKYRIW